MGIIGEAHNVNVLGTGPVTIVLGHGFGTDQSVWRHLIPHLIDDYRVILYDNMGSGSTNPEYFDFEKYSQLDGYVSDLLAILEEFQVDSCIFVGHSLSSMVGLIASITRPDIFTKIVMVSASPRLMNDEHYYGGFEEEDVIQIFEAIRSNYEAWCSGFAPMIVGGDLESMAIQEFSRTLFNMRPDITLSVVQLIFQSDIRLLLSSVTVPCHIIQSINDRTVPVVVSEYM